MLQMTEYEYKRFNEDADNNMILFSVQNSVHLNMDN